jgi:hypothetical protein
MLVVILAVGSLAVGMVYLNSIGESDGTEGLATSETRPPEAEDPGTQTETPDEEPEEPSTQVQDPSASPDETAEPPGEEPCGVSVESITMSSDMVYAGEPVEALIVLKNGGSAECLYELNVNIAGQYEVSREVPLDPGEIKEITVEITRNDTGGYTVYAGDESATFYSFLADFIVTGLTITPETISPGEPFTVSARIFNPNHIEASGIVRLRIGEGEPQDRAATVGPQSSLTVTVNTTMYEPGWHYVRAGNSSGFIEVAGETNEGEGEPDQGPTTPEPTFYWEPDPLTDDFTNILPPGASPVRLSLPASIDDIFFEWEAGPAGYGLHSGGHIEGLDHVWIEIRSGEPVKSWGDGVVTEVQLSGDVEEGEIFITIDYGQGLIGTHMEIITSLVEVGDSVSRGDPVGYGMSYFPGQQSAEFGLVDRGRTDGVWVGDGAAVSPYDYLVEEDKLALVAAYKAHTVEKYGGDSRITWLFDASQPYLTNPLLIHTGNEGRLTGEWYLYSSPWEPGWPNDMLIFIEAENPWYTGNRVLSNDDTGEDSQTSNIEGTFDVDYGRGRVLIHNTKYGGTLFGIFEIDETGERALLRIEFDELRYPDEFTDEALVYIERTNLSRRQDAAELGLLDGP